MSTPPLSYVPLYCSFEIGFTRCLAWKSSQCFQSPGISPVPVWIFVFKFCVCICKCSENTCYGPAHVFKSEDNAGAVEGSVLQPHGAGGLNVGHELCMQQELYSPISPLAAPTVVFTYFMCISVLSVCVCAPCACGALACQKRALDPPGLELEL